MDLINKFNNDDFQKCKNLINSTRNLNTVYNGSTILHLAVKKLNLEIVKMLLDKKAKPNIKDKSGRIPLRLMINYYCRFNLQYKCSSYEAREILKLLIEAGSDINSVENDGTPPLYSAVIHNNTSIVEILLQNGADANFIDNKGYSLLHLAIERNKGSNIKLLLNHGAKINELNPKGETPFNAACFSFATKNNLELLLCDYKADPNTTDNKGRFPLLFAIGIGDPLGHQIIIEI